LGRISLDVPAWFWPIAFTSDGRGLIGQSTASVEIANETYLWDTDTGKRQPLTETFATTKGSILTPPVGGAVLFREQDVRTVTLREWPTGRLRHTFALPSPQPPADEHVALSAALSPDGRRAAVAGRDNRKAGDATYYGSGYVSLFDTTAGRLIRGWSTPHAYFDRVVFTPDGGALIGGGYTVQPFDPAGGPRGVGQYKAEQALQLFDIEAGQAVRSYLPPGVDATAHRRIAALAVSPDGRQVAAAESDYSIWVYELATGQARRHFVGHSNEVTALAFTPDGQRLISTSRDLTALVWDVSQAGAE
jgi:WD40 repeat protein